jgi:hypothetical protein
MKQIGWISAALVAGLLPLIASAEENKPVSTRYKALKSPAPSMGSTWAILDHDGANRKVEPYLSSLGEGEAGTGMITSPPFHVTVDKITFTICGHDGAKKATQKQKQRQGENCLVLVDARKGNVLLETPAPGSDGMKEESWDVKAWRDTEVRIEARDENGGASFAWMGVGRIDAGPAMTVDFRQGMPKGWASPQNKANLRYEALTGGVPFKRATNVFTLIPKSGAVEIPCGFTATRLFFLGCTVAGGKPLQTYAGIELHYRTGSPDVFPLMCGFTLDGGYKKLSASQALRLHASSDPYQPYLAIKPRTDVIEKIRLVTHANADPIARITAITCETSADSERLMPLPESSPDAAETAWIDSHSVAAGQYDLGQIMEQIRKANQLPPEAATPVRFRKHRLDTAFRSEGVAVADFNGDGKLDIAAGNVYYAGPDWKMVPMLGEAKEYNRFGYSDSFLCFADDLNHDKAMDLIVVGFPGQQTHWLENPGKQGGVWKRHLAIERTGAETPAYIDIDGDGRRELVYMDGGKCLLAKPGDDPTQPWTTQAISKPGEPAPGHGLGVGDVNGDGRLDVVIPDGWWEGPAQRGTAPWAFHAGKIFGGAQLCVQDIDGDGKADVLGSSAHDYGIAWSQQTAEGWQSHDIDSSISQTHAIELADINRDGKIDFVTGKRFWAHNGHDTGSFQPALLYWFERTQADGHPAWVRHLIDADSGVGLQVAVIDVNGDGLLDVVMASKKGVYYFEQVAKDSEL